MPIITLKLSTSDLFAFALYAITLNQERSVEDVGPMQNIFFFIVLAVCTTGCHHCSGKAHGNVPDSAFDSVFNNIYFIDYVGF